MRFMQSPPPNPSKRLIDLAVRNVGYTNTSLPLILRSTAEGGVAVVFFLRSGWEFVKDIPYDDTVSLPSLEELLLMDIEVVPELEETKMITCVAKLMYSKKKEGGGWCSTTSKHVDITFLCFNVESGYYLVNNDAMPRSIKDNMRSVNSNIDTTFVLPSSQPVKIVVKTELLVYLPGSPRLKELRIRWEHELGLSTGEALKRSSNSPNVKAVKRTRKSNSPVSAALASPALVIPEVLKDVLTSYNPMYQGFSERYFRAINTNPFGPNRNLRPSPKKESGSSGYGCLLVPLSEIKGNLRSDYFVDDVSISQFLHVVDKHKQFNLRNDFVDLLQNKDLFERIISLSTDPTYRINSLGGRRLVTKEHGGELGIYPDPVVGMKVVKWFTPLNGEHKDYYGTVTAIHIDDERKVLVSFLYSDGDIETLFWPFCLIINNDHNEPTHTRIVESVEKPSCYSFEEDKSLVANCALDVDHLVLFTSLNKIAPRRGGVGAFPTYAEMQDVFSKSTFTGDSCRSTTNLTFALSSFYDCLKGGRLKEPGIKCDLVSKLNCRVVPTAHLPGDVFNIYLFKKSAWTNEEIGLLFRCYLASTLFFKVKISNNYSQVTIERLRKIIAGEISQQKSELFSCPRGNVAALLACEVFSKLVCKEDVTLVVESYGAKATFTESVEVEMKTTLLPSDAGLIAAKKSLDEEWGNIHSYNLIINIRNYCKKEKITARTFSSLGVSIQAEQLMKDGEFIISKRVASFLPHPELLEIEERGRNFFWQPSSSDQKGEDPDPKAIVNKLLSKHSIYSSMGLPLACANTVNNTINGDVNRVQTYTPAFRELIIKTTTGKNPISNIGDLTACIIPNGYDEDVLRADLFYPAVNEYAEFMKQFLLGLSEFGCSTRMEVCFELAEEDGVVPLKNIKRLLSMAAERLQCYDSEEIARYVGLNVSSQVGLLQCCLQSLGSGVGGDEAVQLYSQIGAIGANLSNMVTGVNVATSPSLYNAHLSFLIGRSCVWLGPLTPYVLREGAAMPESDLKTLNEMICNQTIVMNQKIEHDKSKQALLLSQMKADQKKVINPGGIVVCGDCFEKFFPLNKEDSIKTYSACENTSWAHRCYRQHIEAHPDHGNKKCIKGDDPRVAINDADNREALTPEQKQVVHNVMSKRNCYISGKAGTGKSRTIKELVQTVSSLFGSSSIAVVATTGMAASNLKLSPPATTLHSFFGIGLRWEFGDDELKILAAKLARNPTFKDLRVVIIDEVSLLRNKLLSLMNKLCKYAKYSNELFGGITFVLAGDCLQFPLIQREGGQLDWIFRGLHSTIFNDAFPKDYDHRVVLTKVFRQTNAKFVSFLDRQRMGCLTNDDFEYFKTFGADFDKYKKVLRLHFLNETANRLNAEDLEKATGVAHTFVVADVVREDVPTRLAAIREARWKEDKSLVPLVLKEGCPVTVVVNIPELGLSNGTRGIFSGIGGSENSSMLFTYSNAFGKEVTVHIEKVKASCDYGFNQDAFSLGSVTQYPVILSYHLSLMRAQGSQTQTDEALYLDLGGTTNEGVCFVAASAYVGVGRALDERRIKVVNINKHGTEEEVTLDLLNCVNQAALKFEREENNRQLEMLKQISDNSEDAVMENKKLVVHTMHLAALRGINKTTMSTLLRRTPTFRGCHVEDPSIACDDAQRVVAASRPQVARTQVEPANASVVEDGMEGEIEWEHRVHMQMQLSGF